MRLCALLAIAWTFAAAEAFAQTGSAGYAGRIVSNVRLLVDDQPAADPLLLDLIETRTGEPLSIAAVRETITHLYSIGRFQDIQVEATEAGNGAIELTYTLVPIHAVERVEFRGTLGLSEGLLRETVADRFGRTPPIGRTAEVVRVLERLYEDRGYFRASIRAESTELRNPARTILTFQVNAGPQARIRSLEVAGDPGTSREALLARLDLAPGRPYQRARINERLAEHVQRLKSRGHLQAVATHTPVLADDGSTADLTIDVRAGPVVTVAFDGDPLPASRRDELVPIERESSVDEDLLEDSVQRIRDYLRQQGYWRGDVSWDSRGDAATLTITFRIRRGALYRVADEGVDVTGNKAIPIQEIRPLIPVSPGELYVSSQLDAASAAVENLYRTRGFAWVDVKTAEEEIGVEGGTGAVRPRIVIVEGPRAAVGEITITGASALSESEIRRVMQLKPGMPFQEPTLRQARDAVDLEYLNLGFASAQVRFTPSISEDRTRVDLTVAIDEGPQTMVDHVIVVGNRKTADEVIRREVVLQPGSPLGLRDLLESRRRLSALGLFRRIDIRELEHGPATRRDVLITVEEAPATSLGYGGGLEFMRRLRAAGPGGEAEERIELAPRGFFDIGRRNLWGKNRAVNLFTRVSLRPSDSSDPDEDGQGFGFSEYRIVGTFREPRALGWHADFTLTGAVEQGVRSSFNFTRKGVTAELLRRLTPALGTSVRYSFSTTRTFDERLSPEEQALIDRRFPQVRLSIVSGAISIDRRDDLVEPSSGSFFSAEASMASRATGGQVGFMKTYLQGYWFKTVPRTSRVILAMRASLGLADGFAREVPPTDDEGRPIEGPPVTIEDLPASERFFAGGDTTIRGFALDTVGAPETISARGFPRGGNAVLILNGELRVPIWKDIGAALFVDGGNVFARVTHLDAGELRGSSGFGLRYRSPIGPIRLDLGFKMDRRMIGDELESAKVLHFSIGQAF